MILRNEETNSEILLQFFFVSWAKYYFMMSQCVRVLAGLWWFLYQIFQVSCLLAGNNIMGINYWHSCFSRPSHTPPAGRDQDVNLSPLAWAGEGQVKCGMGDFPTLRLHSLSHLVLAGFLSAWCWCCSAPPANYWDCTERRIVKRKLPNWGMSWWVPMTFIKKINKHPCNLLLRSSHSYLTLVISALFTSCLQQL